MPREEPAQRVERVVADLRRRIEQLEEALRTRADDDKAQPETSPPARPRPDLTALLVDAMAEAASRAGAAWAGGLVMANEGPVCASGFAPRLPDTRPYEQERFFTGLASAPRLKMVRALLENGPLTVNELMEAIDAQTTGQVYHHLRALVVAGIVSPAREGRAGLTDWAAPRVAVALSLVDAGEGPT